MALDPETAVAVRDTVARILSGRETVPGDLPYPPAINVSVREAIWPDGAGAPHPISRHGREVGRAVRQVYVAGYMAGRLGDTQIGEQVRRALDLDATAARATHHPHVGLAVCLVCDQAPDHPVHVEPGGAVTAPIPA